jgi:Tfp pilus assembly protein PilF
MKRTAWIALLASAAVLLGCVQPAPIAVSDLRERPGEKALLAGLRAYEDAQYPEAEKLLTDAVKLGLAAGRDLSNAQKYLAFIYCTSNRLAQCEAAFRAARAADPQFALTRAEIGHPLWGPVYKKIASQ